MELGKALKLTEKKMAEHGLTGWTVSVMPRSKGSSGMCHHIKKTISLGVYLTENRTEEQALNTILHEIAHALCGMLKRPHCWIWREKFISIGGNGKTCWND